MAGWILARVCPALDFDFPARGWVAATFALLGMVCSILGVASFRRARTTVNPLKPDSASTLVVSGIYRVTRNPMYLGFLFLLVAELVWLSNAIALFAAAFFVIYMNAFQIVPEEQALARAFGIEFLNYTTRVRRWL
jgi:protein-S-isoprenylcysteine O-methyltransferase Ste14